MTATYAQDTRTQDGRTFVVLMADDPDDVALVSDALAEGFVQSDFRSVGDGFKLIQYLNRRSPYADPALAPDPDLLLLDLNMPKRNGIEVLAEMKKPPRLRGIPVVILTTSDAERDRFQTSALGADGYLTKPNSDEARVEMTWTLQSFCATRRGLHA